MPLNNKQLLYGLVGLGVVLAAILLGYTYRTRLGDVLHDLGFPVTGSRTELQIQEQLGDLIKGGNFDDCKKIGNAYYETVCINNIALQLAQERLDVSYCQKIDNKLIPIADCERQVIFRKAVDREDIAVCDETKNEELRVQCRADFLLSLAFKKNDIRVCEQETAPERRTECVDTYMFQKEYVSNPTGFHCSRFLGDSVRQDCNAVETFQGREFDKCLGLQSNLFTNYCMTRTIR